MKPELNRREFLKKGMALALVGGTGGYLLLRFVGAREGAFFRPPGAGSEQDFLARCIRCAKCVQACPYDAIKLGEVSHGISTGTPLLEFRDTPCYMCNELPCIRACPTDALDPQLTDPTRMILGTAVITDREACLSLNGIRCEICYRTCPLIDRAITIETRGHEITGRHAIFEPVVHKEVCTGCGVCENACPLDDSAITVIRSQRGDKSDHYDYLREQSGGRI